jgi:hypothetical protein
VGESLGGGAQGRGDRQKWGEQKVRAHSYWRLCPDLPPHS